MLNLTCLEFHKLKRSKILFFLLLTALVMPILGTLYFRISGVGDFTEMKFYKTTVISYTPWIILPIVIGALATLLMNMEKKNDTLKQLLLIPVGVIKLFLSKLLVCFLTALGYMIVSALAAVFFGMISGLITINANDMLFLSKKCIEISALTTVGIIPIQVIGGLSKGYMLPVCLTIVYTFMGFIMLMVNMYLHPLSSACALWMKDVPGVSFNQEYNPGAAIMCIFAWTFIFLTIMAIKIGKGDKLT